MPGNRLKDTILILKLF